MINGKSDVSDISKKALTKYDLGCCYILMQHQVSSDGDDHGNSQSISPRHVSII